CQHSYGPPFTF
nr:immunoglobulin light chain junction region [Macaca mulatta]